MLKTHFWLDTINLSIFLIVLKPHFTGDALHEWIAVSIVITLIIHFLFHWDWFIRIVTSFFKNPFHISRLNLIIAVTSFIGFTTLITSGLVISESFMPTFGWYIPPSRGWYGIHEFAANLTLLVIALHFALHWEWVKNTFIRVIVAPIQKGKTKSNDVEAGHA